MMTRATDSLPLKGACLVATLLQGEEQGEVPQSCRRMTAEDGVYRADDEVGFSVSDDDFVRYSII